MVCCMPARAKRAPLAANTADALRRCAARLQALRQSRYHLSSAASRTVAIYGTFGVDIAVAEGQEKQLFSSPQDQTV